MLFIPNVNILSLYGQIKRKSIFVNVSHWFCLWIFVQIYVLFWLWLPIHLCLWFQIFILFWHWFPSDCTRNLCLTIFWSCGKALKGHKNISISLSPNLILNWGWCMVKKDQQLMWCCTMFKWRNHVCQGHYFDIRLFVWLKWTRNWSWALLKRCEGDVVYALEWWQGTLIIS